MPHFVYMLRCKGDRIYTGYAVDVQARYEQHCSGRGARFTRAFPPEGILRTFELDSRERALRLEARIKRLKREEKVRLASGDKSLWKTLEEGLSERLPPKKRRKTRILKTAKEGASPG